MNGYLLATDVVAESLLPQPDSKVEAWFAWAYERPKYLSVLTAGEMERAVRAVTDARRRSQMVAWLSFSLRNHSNEFLLPVSLAVSSRWGQLTAIAPKRVKDIDLLVAATAAEHGLALVTGREKAFAGLGLDIINPYR